MSDDLTAQGVAERRHSADCRAQEMSRQAEAILLTARAEQFLAIAASRAVPPPGEALVRDLFDLTKEQAQQIATLLDAAKGETQE